MSSLMTGVLNELKSENQRLENELIFINKCLNVLFKFKTNLFEIFNSRTSSETICLTSEDIQLFKDIDEEYNGVLAEKEIKSELNEELFEIQNNETIVNIINITSDSEQMITENVSPIISLKEELPQISDQLNDNNCDTLVIKSENENTIHISNVKSCETSDGLEDNSKEQNVCNVNKTSNECNQSQSNGKFKCNEIGCDFKFNLKTEILSHEKECHKEAKNSQTCEFCCKYFRSKSYYNYHKEFVRCRKRYKCDFQCCERIFATQTALDNHYSRSHSNTEFKCKEKGCIYKTCNKLHFNWHMKRIHTNDLRFKCEIDGCVAKFNTKILLEHHTRSHYDMNPRFKCQFEGCGQEYRNVVTLRKHQKIHSSEELLSDVTEAAILDNKIDDSDNDLTSGNFVCVWPECDQRFKYKHILDSHNSRFEHKTAQSCEYKGCIFKCYKKDQLKRHLKYHLKIPVHNSLSCKWSGCSYATNRLNDLIRHRGHHLNFSCDVSGCEHKASNYANLLSHKSTHNKKQVINSIVMNSNYKIKD